MVRQRHETEVTLRIASLLFQCCMQWLLVMSMAVFCRPTLLEWYFSCVCCILVVSMVVFCRPTLLEWYFLTTFGSHTPETTLKC